FVGTPGKSVSATATSGLPVTYGSSTPLVCTVGASNGALTLLSAGTCTITADQGGSAIWLAAPQAMQTFAVANPTPPGVVPNSVGRGAISFPITITGTGFAPGSTVSFSGSGVMAGTPTSITPTQIVVPVSVTTSATTGNRNVIVNVPGAPAATCTNCL